jgi:hypothetical protein
MLELFFVIVIQEKISKGNNEFFQMDAIEQIVYKVPNVVAKSLPKCQLYHIMVIDQTKLNHHLSLKLVFPIGHYQICRNNNCFASFSPSCN